MPTAMWESVSYTHVDVYKRQEHEGLRYTIINAKPITGEWVDMAISKYKKDFDIA